MSDRLARRWNAAAEALETIPATDPDAYARVALAVAPLPNRTAQAGIIRWLQRHGPRGPGAWRNAQPAIWAERKRLKAANLKARRAQLEERAHVH